MLIMGDHGTREAHDYQENYLITRILKPVINIKIYLSNNKLGVLKYLVQVCSTTPPEIYPMGAHVPI